MKTLIKGKVGKVMKTSFSAAIKLIVLLEASLFLGCASAPKKEDVSMEEFKINNEAIENHLIFGTLFKPSGQGKFPAIIFSHGYNGVGADFFEDCSFFAKNGFVAYCYDFCGGSMRSRSKGRTVDMTLLTEKSDLIAVVDAISNLDCVDESQIFLLGGSQGGLVTALAIEEIGEKIKGVSLYYPAFCIPDDWRKNFPDKNNIPKMQNFWGMNLGRNFFETAIEMDVNELTGKYAGPVLIVHGSADDIVPLRYAEEAQKRYPNARLEVLPGERHGFSPVGAQTARNLVLEHVKSLL